MVLGWFVLLQREASVGDRIAGAVHMGGRRMAAREVSSYREGPLQLLQRSSPLQIHSHTTHSLACTTDARGHTVAKGGGRLGRQCASGPTDIRPPRSSGAQSSNHEHLTTMTKKHRSSGQRACSMNQPSLARGSRGGFKLSSSTTSEQACGP